MGVKLLLCVMLGLSAQRMVESCDNETLNDIRTLLDPFYRPDTHHNISVMYSVICSDKIQQDLVKGASKLEPCLETYMAVYHPTVSGLFLPYTRRVLKKLSQQYMKDVCQTFRDVLPHTHCIQNVMDCLINRKESTQSKLMRLLIQPTDKQCSFVNVMIDATESCILELFDHECPNAKDTVLPFLDAIMKIIPRDCTLPQVLSTQRRAESCDNETLNEIRTLLDPLFRSHHNLTVMYSVICSDKIQHDLVKGASKLETCLETYMAVYHPTASDLFIPYKRRVLKKLSQQYMMDVCQTFRDVLPHTHCIENLRDSVSKRKELFMSMLTCSLTLPSEKPCSTVNVQVDITARCFLDLVGKECPNAKDTAPSFLYAILKIIPRDCTDTLLQGTPRQGLSELRMVDICDKQTHNETRDMFNHLKGCSSQYNFTAMYSALCSYKIQKGLVKAASKMDLCLETYMDVYDPIVSVWFVWARRFLNKLTPQYMMDVCQTFRDVIPHMQCIQNLRNTENKMKELLPSILTCLMTRPSEEPCSIINVVIDVATSCILNLADKECPNANETAPPFLDAIRKIIPRDCTLPQGLRAECMVNSCGEETHNEIRTLLNVLYRPEINHNFAVIYSDICSDKIQQDLVKAASKLEPCLETYMNVSDPVVSGLYLPFTRRVLKKLSQQYMTDVCQTFRDVLPHMHCIENIRDSVHKRKELLQSMLTCFLTLPSEKPCSIVNVVIDVATSCVLNLVDKECPNAKDTAPAFLDAILKIIPKYCTLRQENSVVEYVNEKMLVDVVFGIMSIFI